MFFTEKRVKKRVSEAEEHLEKLERDFKSLQLEWENSYAKFLRIVQRISKQAQVVAAAEEDEIPEGLEVTEMPGGALNERQRKIQGQILAQRARRGNGVLPG